MAESIEMKSFVVSQLNGSPASSSSAQQPPVLPTTKSSSKLNTNIEYYDTIRERFSYAIAIQVFVAYLIFLYYERINKLHPLTAGLLLGAQTSALAQSLTQYYHRIFSLNKHIKFYIWGMINGLMTTFWINLLLSHVESTIARFILDQSVGACIFQFAFVTFNCIWERINLIKTLKTTYIMAMKYSLMVWPVVSFVSFNYLREDLIFPLNCLTNLLFTVILAILT